MNIAVVCKSDAVGGAAIVSRRLTEALRQEGEDASLLVLDKRSAEDFVVPYGNPLKEKFTAAADRLPVLLGNGFSIKNIWKTDAGSFGLPLWKHTLVKEADAVILNWTNQGMLSLKGLRRLCAMRKKIVCIMHDMWPMTGICHYSLDCENYRQECGDCPFLGRAASPHDLSFRTWRRKLHIYDRANISFVAVSRWLAGCAHASSLLRERPIHVIPNAFNPVPADFPEREGSPAILFPAASLDNWIKGLDTFIEVIGILRTEYPGLGDVRPLFLGSCRNPGSLPGEYLGMVTDERRLAQIYGSCDVVVNCSEFENLPGTLVEAQAYGAVPVTFDRGGQSDIISHLSTGYLAPWSDALPKRAAAIADGIAWALSRTPQEKKSMRRRMLSNVVDRFGYKAVASRILALLK